MRPNHSKYGTCICFLLLSAFAPHKALYTTSMQKLGLLLKWYHIKYFTKDLLLKCSKPYGSNLTQTYLTQQLQVVWVQLTSDFGWIMLLITHSCHSDVGLFPNKVNFSMSRKTLEMFLTTQLHLLRKNSNILVYFWWHTPKLDLKGYILFCSNSLAWTIILLIHL